MNRENQLLVTVEPFSLRNNRLKFKTLGKLPIKLEEFIEYTQSEKEKPKDCTVLSGWTWKH